MAVWSMLAALWPSGPRGERGSTGLPGRMEDGNTVLSGPRMPDPEEGKDGDHFIDWSDLLLLTKRRPGAKLRHCNPASGTQTAELQVWSSRKIRALKLHKLAGS